MTGRKHGIRASARVASALAAALVLAAGGASAAEVTALDCARSLIAAGVV